MVDYPDGTLPISVAVNAEIVNKVVTMPWWIKYTPARIVFLDDFEGFNRWGASATKYSGRGVFEGSYCARFITAATKGESTDISMYLGAIPRSKLAIQLRWTPYAADPDYYHSFAVALVLSDGDSCSYAGVRYLKHYTTAKNRWQYLVNETTYNDIPDSSETINMTEEYIQSLYFSADFTGSVLKLDRLITSALDLDLSTLDIYDTNPLDEPVLAIFLTVQTDADEVSEAMVDALCLSDNEP